MTNWDHAAVFRALWDRHGGQRQKAGRYAYLYPQRLGENSALLYEPESTVRNTPLFLRAEAASARPMVFAALQPFIKFRYEEKKRAAFTRYAVEDWDGFAQTLGLPQRP